MFGRKQTTNQAQKSTPYVFAALKTYGYALPEAEYRFHPVRRWRFDYAWPETKLALEVEGGVFTGGRHTRGAGFVADMEKYNAAAAMGWRVLRCQPKDLKKMAIMYTVMEALAWQP